MEQCDLPQPRTIELQLAARIFANGEKCFGPGIAELLERIDSTASIRQAANEMGMAFSKSWAIINNCERALNIVLVERHAGGIAGGGSHVTEQGRQLTQGYRDMRLALQAQGDALARQLLDNLAISPAEGERQ